MLFLCVFLPVFSEVWNSAFFRLAERQKVPYLWQKVKSLQNNKNTLKTCVLFVFLFLCSFMIRLYNAFLLPKHSHFQSLPKVPIFLVFTRFIGSQNVPIFTDRSAFFLPVWACLFDCVSSYKGKKKNVKDQSQQAFRFRKTGSTQLKAATPRRSFILYPKKRDCQV